MKKEDIEFLNELKNDMINGEHDSQASPRFWVIRQYEKLYWVDSDNSDGIFVFDNDNCEIEFEGDFGSCEMIEWLKKIIKDKTNKSILDVYFDFDLNFTLEEEEYCIYDNEDLTKFLEEECLMNVSIGYYKIQPVIKEDTLFITKEEAKEHLKSNYYHYNETAHTYDMTAWRSPKIKKLFEILETTNWENLK